MDGKKSEAEQLYRKISLENANSSAARTAKKYLRLLGVQPSKTEAKDSSRDSGKVKQQQQQQVSN